MPTSLACQIPRIIRVAQELRPRRVLDVGIGFGKYGLLLREYLELWGPGTPDDRPWPPPRRTTIDGIEACEDYVGDLQRMIYDHIHIGDAVTVLRGMAGNAYDLALMIDILEHFDPEAGREAVDQVTRVATFVVISTPSRVVAQGPAFGNPLEQHRSHWRLGDLRAIAPTVVVPRAQQAVHNLYAPSTLAVLSRRDPQVLGRLGLSGILRRRLGSAARSVWGRLRRR
jgi:hypothetical protein